MSFTDMRNEMLTGKCIENEYLSAQYRNAVEAAAGMVSHAHPDTWAGWVVYFLESLDSRKESEEPFLSTLEQLQDAIRGRLEGGRW